MTETVVVRRHWNDWRRATYLLTQLSGVHWSALSGGHQARSARPFLHGYVSCDAMLDGELAHSGIHGPCPHQIKVCIVKKDNSAAVIRALVEKADEKQQL